MLILLSRVSINNEGEKLEEIIETGLDWYQMLNLAVRHKVLPLAWFNLKKLDFESKIPRKVRQVMYLYYLSNSERNKLFLKIAKDVFNQIGKSDLKVAPLKGFFMLEAIYKDFGIRTLNDIDCLIHSKDVKKIREKMNTLGYVEGKYDFKQKIVNPITREAQMLWALKMNNLHPFVKQVESVYLENMRFDFSVALDMNKETSLVDDILSRYQINSEGFIALDEVDFFAHLCSHLYKEASQGMWIQDNNDFNLIKFCDVREYIKFYYDDELFKRLLGRFSESENVKRAIYFSLYCLKQIYNDGYENNWMNLIEFESYDFINEYYQKGEKHTWGKSFWSRIFALDNSDILEKDFVKKYEQSKQGF